MSTSVVFMKWQITWGHIAEYELPIYLCIVYVYSKAYILVRSKKKYLLQLLLFFSLWCRLNKKIN